MGNMSSSKGARILAQRGSLSTYKNGPEEKYFTQWKVEKLSGVFCKRKIIYAALLAADFAFGSAATASSSHFTETSFDTPGSCIVTP